VPALRELGYTEGLNIAFDRRFADGDANMLDELAQQLVKQRVDVIVALSTPVVRAARRATSTIPIVGIGMADPVEDGLASSLGRPGGNVTGTTFLGPELVSKRLQFFDRKGLQFPVSARRYRLIPILKLNDRCRPIRFLFGASVSGDKNPVPNSTRKKVRDQCFAWMPGTPKKFLAADLSPREITPARGTVWPDQSSSCCHAANCDSNHTD
jgi:ABC transporter substrate binding protein